MTTKAERKAAARAAALALKAEQEGTTVKTEQVVELMEQNPDLTMGEAEAQVEQPAPAPKPTGKVLKVKQGLKYRGARQSWYERLLAYDGQPLAAFIANVTEDRPSVYGVRSKHMGSPEPVKGWVRFFERTGVCTEVEHKAE